MKMHIFPYRSFKEFCDRVSKLKALDDRNFTLLCDRILIQFFTKPITLPQFEIIVDDSLGFTVCLNVWFFPETHLLYYNYRRSIQCHRVGDKDKKLFHLQRSQLYL